MKIKSIKPIGRKPVYDISVEDVEHYVLKNGVVSHNTGGIYSSDDIWIIGRRQDKDGAELTGYEFVINIEKSRTVKEKSKIPLNVSFEGGIQTHSALLQLAIDTKIISRTKPGWYARINDNGEIIGNAFRAKETHDPSFWEPIFKETDFNERLRNKFRLDSVGLLAAVKEEKEDDAQ